MNLDYPVVHSFGKKKNNVIEFAVTFGREVLFLYLRYFFSIYCTIMFQFLRATDIYSVPFYLGHRK